MLDKFNIFDISTLGDLSYFDFTDYYNSKYNQAYDFGNNCQILQDYSDITYALSFPYKTLKTKWFDLNFSIPAPYFGLLDLSHINNNNIDYNTKFYSVDIIDGEVSYTLMDDIDGTDFYQDDFEDGIYKIEFADVDSGDMRVGEGLFGIDIDVKPRSTDNLESIYEFKDGLFRQYTGDFIDTGNYRFQDNVQNIYGLDDMIMRDFSLDIDYIDDFSLSFESLDDINSIYLGLDDFDVDEFNYFSGGYVFSNLDILDDISYDGDYSTNIYKLNYYTKDIYGNDFEYNSLGYFYRWEGYYGYNYYFVKLKGSDILYSLSGDDYTFDLDFIDNIEIKNKNGEILYFDDQLELCDDRYNCSMIDAIAGYINMPLELKVEIGGMIYDYFIGYLGVDESRYASDIYFDIYPKSNLINQIMENYTYDFELGIDEFSLDFSNDDGVIMSIGLDDLDVELMDWGLEYIVLDADKRDELFDVLYEHRDQYINYSLSMSPLDPLLGDVFFRSKFYNSSGYYYSRNKFESSESLDLLYCYANDCDVIYDDEDYYNYDGFYDGMNIVRSLEGDDIDDILFARSYNFDIDLGDSNSMGYNGYNFNGLSPQINIETKDDRDPINFDKSKIWICQNSIINPSLDIPTGCMTYRDVLNQGILVPSNNLYIYGLKRLLDDGYDLGGIRVDIRVDIYMTPVDIPS